VELEDRRPQSGGEISVCTGRMTEETRDDTTTSLAISGLAGFIYTQSCRIIGSPSPDVNDVSYAKAYNTSVYFVNVRLPSTRCPGDDTVKGIPSGSRWLHYKFYTLAK